MKFTVAFVMEGPSGKRITGPSTQNPHEVENISELLRQLAESQLHMPAGLGVRYVGVIIEETTT